MKYEWKKGDRLRVIPKECRDIVSSDRLFGFVGKTVISSDDVSTEKGDIQLNISDLNGNMIGTADGWYVRRFEKVSNYKPKQPTHIVIWDEKSRDPHQFFTSEKDARDFIKTLIDKSEVVKESIVLVEVKKVENITISKVLKSKKYLI